MIDGFFYVNISLLMHKVLLYIVLVFVGCSDTGTNSETSPIDIGEAHPFPDFRGFPNTIYKNISPNSSFETVTKALLENGWLLLDESETCTFFNPADTTQIIFKNYGDQPSTPIKEMKLFLFSETYLNHDNSFPTYLEAQADQVQKNDALSVVSISGPTPYSLTIFPQKNMVRLVFDW